MLKNTNLESIKTDILNKKISIIDVREVNEFAEGHVPGAINIPLSQLESRYQELEQDTHHYIICRSGRRSLDACSFLSSKGYDTTNVEGGTLAWTDELEK